MSTTAVLHLIDTAGPGGAETVYADLVTGLDSSRWRSIPIVHRDDWLAGSLRRRGVDPWLVRTGGSFDYGYLYRLWRIAKRERVRLVQTHLLTTAVYGTLLGRLLRVPVVSVFHGMVDIEADERLASLKVRILDRRSNHIVFVSDALRRAFLERYPLGSARTHVVPNGIDTELYRDGDAAATRAALGIDEDHVLIGAVGNLRRAKDYPLLLKAAALVREQEPRARFVIAGHGKGALEQELIALHRALDLGQSVRFLGLRDDIPNLMRAFDVYVLSSSAEGFSLSTVQAMASGVPVVATRCGGPEEILGDGGGVLVERGSPTALAEALLKLVADPARRRALGTEGRDVATRRFTRRAMVAGYEAIYTDALGPSRGAGTAPAGRAGDEAGVPTAARS